jgi:hypothetical protein
VRGGGVNASIRTELCNIVSYDTGNSTLRIGNNAGVVFIKRDIDMSGGPGAGASIVCEISATA